MTNQIRAVASLIHPFHFPKMALVSESVFFSETDSVTDSVHFLTAELVSALEHLLHNKIFDVSR